MEAMAGQVVAKCWEMILICRCEGNTLHHILQRSSRTENYNVWVIKMYMRPV